MSMDNYTDEELAQAVIDLCDQIEEEKGDSDSATDFAAGVKETAQSMLGSIQDHGQATDKMRASLERMHAGAERWL